MVNSGLAALGLTHIEVLETIARRGEVSTASDFAKAQHASFALLASTNMITCITRDGYVSAAWRVSLEGHYALEGFR